MGFRVPELAPSPFSLPRNSKLRVLLRVNCHAKRLELHPPIAGLSVDGVVTLERFEAVGQPCPGIEVVWRENLAWYNREIDLYMVEPTGLARAPDRKGKAEG